MRLRLGSFLIGLAILGGYAQLASAAPVLWCTAPDSSGLYSLVRIDVAAKTVTPVFPLGNNQVAFNGGLTFDSATGLFNALFSESDDSATFVTFTKDGGGALTGLYKPGFGFHGGLAFASTLNDDYGIESAQDGSSTLLLLPTRAGETIRFAAALGFGFTGGLTFDPLNGEFYAISNDSAGRSTLERIDLASGTVTPVGVSLGFGFTGGLAFDPGSNLLYAIGSDNTGFSTLFSFNTDASGIKAEFPLGFGFNGASLTLGPSSETRPLTFQGMPKAGTTLWPPNGKLVQVAVISASDVETGVASFDVTATSSEPSDPVNPDIVITGTGIAPRVVNLRAERLGTGPGRVYTITATATDGAGNQANATTTVIVPHDQGH
jgi:hypothetical protein